MKLGKVLSEMPRGPTVKLTVHTQNFGSLSMGVVQLNLVYCGCKGC